MNYESLREQPLKLAYLYPELLNIYGDNGNVLCLKHRTSWRGIPLIIEEVNIGSKGQLADVDLFFIGGGQDSQQELVAQALKLRKTELLEALSQSAVVLAICGGYQIFGSYYETSEGQEIEGLGILDIYTKAKAQEPSARQDRLVGNVVAELMFEPQQPAVPKTLVGFENHSGRTYFNSERVAPLAKVKTGYGNNAEDGYEGVIYKNIFGTYLHGSLLPKNPHFADELILRALQKRNVEFTSLAELDDSIELAAHKHALTLAN